MPYHRANFELEMLEVEHKQAMSDMQKLPMEISEALDKCKKLIEESEYFSCLYVKVLRDWPQLKKTVHVLRIKNGLLQREKTELQETCEEVKRLLKEAYEEICDPCAEEHQEPEGTDERLENLLKQKEPVTQERDSAEKLQHHFSQKIWNLSLEPATAQDESLLQTELLQQEH
ncbi:Disks large-like 5 [Sigmodon hispidus]